MWKRTTRGLLFAAVGASLLSLTGCKGTIWSTKEEIQIGKEVAAEVEREYRIDPDPIVQQRVKTIGQRIVAVGGKPQYQYTFTVLDEKEINAFALPGGPIYVFRGLLEKLGDDDDALACVLGHEITHINQRHAAKQYTKGMWAKAALVLLDNSGRVRDGAAIGSALLQLQYSRDDEYESDRYGLEYAYQAGYDPNGMVRFFELLKTLEKGGDKGILANLRTHPLTENRIWRARAQIEKMTGAPPTSDFGAGGKSK